MRKATFERKTTESDVRVSFTIDGQGRSEIDTQIPFFDHMLELFAKHSKFDLSVFCKGDIEVDAHHSVEDIGIAMGKAFFEALQNKKGIARYASLALAMDESLCLSAVDISGRALFVFNADLCGACGNFDAELVKEFFQAFCANAFITLHINLLYGENLHHKAEAIFKSVGRILCEAVKITGDSIPSTKGVL